MNSSVESFRDGLAAALGHGRVTVTCRGAGSRGEEWVFGWTPHRGHPARTIAVSRGWLDAVAEDGDVAELAEAMADEFRRSAAQLLASLN